MNQETFKNLTAEREEIIIELGCGPYKEYSNSIGIDIYSGENIDIIHNLNDGLKFIPDNSVDVLFSRHVLEHIENIDPLIREIYRILKPNGKHIAIVPHHSNPYYYSDLTHKNLFGLYSFDYYCTTNSSLKRKVPAFYNDVKFDITKRKVEFRSRYLVIQIWKRFLTRIINASNGMKEFYESALSSRLSCTEIIFEMQKPKR